VSAAVRRFGWLGLVLVVLIVAACGGGGGGGGGGPTAPPPPPPPQPSLVFTPQGTADANSIVLASGAGSTANSLILEVRAIGVTDLYGLAFDLSYPSAQLQFVRVSAGPLLAGGSVQGAVAGPGSLVAGGTRLGAVPGASGSGVLMTIEFSAVAAGQGAFNFTRNTALDSRGVAIPGVVWAGGTVVVTR
jgi:hypothetical protein